MLLANKETVVTILDTLNCVAFKPLQNNNPIAVHCRKLIAKIDEKSNSQLIKTTHLSNTNGLLTNMVNNAK